MLHLMAPSLSLLLKFQCLPSLSEVFQILPEAHNDVKSSHHYALLILPTPDFNVVYSIVYMTILAIPEV